MASVKQPVCLVAIDGWGISANPDPTGDAIRNANTPVMDGFERSWPFTKLDAHGLAVGHLNIGAGRVVYQDIVRIDLALRNNEFGQLKNINRSFERAKSGNGRLHFLGLTACVPQVYVHFFGDGRDTAPRSAITYLKELQEHMHSIQYGKLATITGRYYAMDRDRRWERIQLATEGIINGKGEKTTDPIATIEARYAQNETDEFLKPIIVDESGLVQDGDTLFFFDFRADRMRQITQAFGVPPTPFETTIPKDLDITTFTQYKADYPFHVAFPPQTMDNVLAEWLSKEKYHNAILQKYAHVTFFFNGGTEAQFDGEERGLIASPKVATYDLKPEMSAKEVGDKVAETVASGKYPFVMCNFAPPDMVGHTGQYDKAILGVEATDAAIGVIFEACQKHGYTLFVTADHGNAEKMIGDNGQPHTAHTTSPVPFVMTSKQHEFVPNCNGALCDVAPTILQVMGLPIPEAMTGQSLIKQ
ncbi:metalloenzyme [Syncephalis fuscata]|nr:metalloenzyme [Syncephalis fuscata]